MTGTLKARVNGQWQTILGSGQDAANVARWNSAWGVVGIGSFLYGTGSVINNQTAAYATLAATTVAGRRYELEVYVNATGATGVGWVFQLLLDGASFGGGQWNWTGGSNANGNGIWQMTPTAGSHTFLVQLACTGAITVYNDGGFYVLRDVGPVTPASIAPPTAGPQVVASGNALGIVAMGAPLQYGSPWVLPASTVTQLTTNLSVMMAVGRRYRVVCVSRAINAVAATETTMPFQLRDGTTLIGTNFHINIPTGGAYGNASGEWFMDGDGTTKSLNVTANSPGGAVNFYTETNFLFYVEDVGPNTSPALPIPATPPAWSPLTFATNWSDFGAGYVGCGYRKIGDVVSLRGLAKSAVTYTPPAQIVMGNLPAGFRPSGSHMFPVIFGGSDTWGGPGRVNVLPNGEVQVVCSADMLSPHSVMSLAGIQFSTTP